MQELIQKYLSQDLWTVATEYDIPEDFVIQSPDIIEMILRSQAIESKVDKQSWLQLLPMMDAPQLTKLKDILYKEKTQMEQLSKKFDDERVETKKKRLAQRQNLDQQQAITQVKQAEAAKAQEEAAKADDLLAGL